MPELPDVEARKKYIEKTSLGQKIDGVRVLDKRILKGISPKAFHDAVKGSKFESVIRRAKYLLIGTDNGTTVLMHFGMTGDLHYGKASEEEPGFDRLDFDLSGGKTLHYLDQRLFGKIAFYRTDDPEKIPDIARLGPEPLDRAFTLRVFSGIVRRHFTTIHQLLMDQELIAGIGNIFADEICYQAKVLPYRKAGSLTDEEIKALFDKIKWTLKRAVQLNADLEGHGDVFLIPHRGKGGKCPRGHELEKEKIGGRTSWFCPVEQE